MLGASVISLTIIAVGILVDQRYTRANRAALEQHVEGDVKLIRSALQARIDADFAGARHLAAEIAVDPSASMAELAGLAGIIAASNSHIARVDYAPDSTLPPVTLFRADSVASSGAPGLSSAIAEGGARLTQASAQAFFLTFPVPAGADTADLSKSMVALTIDAEKFYEVAGLTQSGDSITPNRLPDLDHLQWTVRYIQPRRSEASSFGEVPLAQDDPVSERLDVPGGAFEILAAPRDGWDAAPQNQFAVRLAIILAGAAIVIPAIVTAFLFRDRNRNIEKLKQREKKLVELSQRFSLAMESSDMGIWAVRTTEPLLYWDDRTAALHGCVPSASENEDRIADWYAAVHPDDRDRAEAHFFQCACTESTQTCDMNYRVVLADGSIRYLRSVGTRSCGEEGENQLAGIAWDVTADTLFTQTLRDAKDTSDIKNAELELALDELSSREQELSELSHKLDLALGSYNCGIWEADPVGGGAVWDERMHQLYGLPYKQAATTEEEWLNCIYPDDRKSVLEATNKAIALGTPLQSVQRILLPDGSFRFVRSVGQIHTGRDGEQKIIGIAFDVTADILLTEELKVAKEEADARNIELELAKNRIEFNALHDPLTALANRRKLDLELDQLSKNAQGTRSRFSILHLDLDRFKEINDTLGHAAGDAILVHTSRILSRNVTRGDLVARIGGDEFVILITRAVTTLELSSLSERIIEEMNKPIDFEGFSCRCGVSIGVAQSFGANADARKVLINADIALYQAKEKGRNGYEFFTQDLQANIVTKKRLADDILAGLERDEFTVWYQPQFDATTMELTGAEALVRWKHPDQGVLASGRFLKIAEELNVMARIDQLVLEKALRDKMRWTALGIDLPRISVNVSSKRLHDTTLADQLEGLSIRPGEVAFELVESIFLDDIEDAATSNLDRIKSFGIDIEIDDFGTGHTSIVSLLRLKPKRLKIDRQLVMPILNSPQERALVRSIVEIARSLGVETIAEGVETHEHAALLKILGCDQLQGFAFAKPLSFEEFTRFASRTPKQKAS
ncbi:MAG TPA: diguanylate cyclase [Rhizobium sp.]|nr:diguanylate cyclase [Rhizobium sp.]